MTPWEEELLQTLTLHLRLFTHQQAARLWWPGQSRSLRNARESVARLKSNGWVVVSTVLARPVKPLASPLVTWTPRNDTPDFARLVRKLSRRALAAAARETRVITSTRKTNECFGRGGRSRIKLTQVTHDLQMVEVFIRYSLSGWEGLTWVGEDQLGRAWPRRQRPDAVLVDSENHLRRVLEYGGDYPVARLRRFHDAAASLDTPYEIW